MDDELPYCNHGEDRLRACPIYHLILLFLLSALQESIFPLRSNLCSTVSPVAGRDRNRWEQSQPQAILMSRQLYHCALDVWDVLPKDQNLCSLLHPWQDNEPHHTDYEAALSERQHRLLWQSYELLQYAYRYFKVDLVWMVPYVDKSLHAHGAREIRL